MGRAIRLCLATRGATAGIRLAPSARGQLLPQRCAELFALHRRLQHPTKNLDPTSTGSLARMKRSTMQSVGVTEGAATQALPGIDARWARSRRRVRLLSFIASTSCDVITCVAQSKRHSAFSRAL